MQVRINLIIYICAYQIYITSPYLHICYISIIRSFKSRYEKLHMRLNLRSMFASIMDLIEANREPRLNVLEAIEFAAES